MDINKMYTLKEKLCKELESMADGTINGSNINMIDTLARSAKNLGKVIAMEQGGEYSSAPGWSNPMGVYHHMNSYGADPYAGGYSRMDSYARSRDSMGRYSRGGGKQEMINNLEMMLDEAPTENERMAIQRCIDQMRK